MISFEFLEYISRHARIGERPVSILDIGTQNVVRLTTEQVWNLLDSWRVKTSKAMKQEVKSIAERSEMRNGQETAYLSELFALSGSVDYESLDLAPGKKTKLFNLNKDDLPDPWRGRFDVVIDFGTSTFCVAQERILRLKHDALKVGGVFVDQAPAFGLWESYFLVTPTFYRDLAAANQYLILDMFYTVGGGQPYRDGSVEIRAAEDLARAASGDPQPMSIAQLIPNLVLNIVMQKKKAAPLQLPMNFRFSHGDAHLR